MNKLIQHRAPMTLALICEVNDTLRVLSLTREALRVELNKILCDRKKIKGNHSGIVKLNRWLNPTSDDWVEPKAEIALALNKFIQSKKGK